MIYKDFENQKEEMKIKFEEEKNINVYNFQ